MQEQNISNMEIINKELIINCGKCGRPLSAPVSMERGYGPKCWGNHDKTKALYSNYLTA